MKKSFLLLLLSLLTLPAPAQNEFTGKGVNVVIIDAGFDLLHPAFTDETGKTRIKELYVCYDRGGQTVVVDDAEKGSYTLNGSVYNTPEEYARLKTDLASWFLEMHPSPSHGSHVAGIAAARRSPDGMEGQAPGCDIYLVSMDGGIPIDGSVTGISEAGVLDDIATYIIHRVASNGQPTVINYSKGEYAGPHDGTGPLVAVTRKLAEKGIIFCAATGNAGNSARHLYKAFSGPDDAVRSFIANPEPDMPDSLTGYTRSGNNISLQYEIYDSEAGRVAWTSAPVKPQDGMKTFNSMDDASLAPLFNGELTVRTPEWVDGRTQIVFCSMGELKSRNLRLAIVAKGGSGTEVDFWGSFHSWDVEGYSDGIGDINNTELSSSDYVISVGSYDEKGKEGTPGAISRSSSYGISLDGVAAPIICAPGVNVLSCVNACANIITDGLPEWNGHYYGRMGGTSMASPYMAGVIATWLEANPRLTLDNIKEILLESAIEDSFTEEAGEQAGGGKFDKQAALQLVISSLSVRSIEDLDPATDSGWYSLDGRRLSGMPVSGGIYIHNGKKVKR